MDILAFEATVGKGLEDMLLNPDGAWRWLLKPARELATPITDFPYNTDADPPNALEDTAWQSSFTNLRKLTITLSVEHITFTRRSGGGCIGDNKAAEVRKWLQQTNLDLKAVEVEVKVRHGDPEDECGWCWEIAATLKDMVKSM